MPDCEVVVLVRPGQRESAAERTRREILRNDCFDRLRRELGDRFDEAVERRLSTIAGDVGRDGLGLDEAGRRAARHLRHRDPLGRDRQLRRSPRRRRRGQPARPVAGRRDAPRVAAEDGSAAPHLVAVSTAYVNSGHKGDATEELITSEPLVAETRLAGRGGGGSPGQGRRRCREPGSLRRLGGVPRQARRARARRSRHVAARRATERLREDWVSDRWSTPGAARAQALGWPDAYAYTKSLGERALLDAAATSR